MPCESICMQLYLDNFSRYLNSAWLNFIGEAQTQSLIYSHVHFSWKKAFSTRAILSLLLTCRIKEPSNEQQWYKPFLESSGLSSRKGKIYQFSIFYVNKDVFVWWLLGARRKYTHTVLLCLGLCVFVLVFLWIGFGLFRHIPLPYLVIT